MKKYYLLLLFLIPGIVIGQTTQTIRGRVVDKQSKFPVEGATVMLPESNPLVGTQTDQNGEFRLKDIPVGRHNLKISLLGYSDQFVNNVLLTAGKELFLNIELEEQIMEMEEVVIEGKDKSKPNNEMSTVSTRTFSIDETKRYAGSL